MSAADIRQGKNWSTRDLAYKLRIIAGVPCLNTGDKAVIRAAADRLEMLKSKLDLMDDYDQKRHSGLLEE